MDSLRSILPRVLRKRGLHAHATAALVVHTASLWLEEHLPEHGTGLTVLNCKDGVLTVAADHSIALQECRERSEALLLHLRARLPDIRVTEIRPIRKT